MTAMSSSPDKRRHNASASAVFPEPTGPPIPIFNGRGIALTI